MNLLGFRKLLFLLILVCTSAWARTIEQFHVVVPVYRELYSQNIASILESFDVQNLDGLKFQKIDVWFVVNNTASADDEVRLENQETVALLKDLAEGKAPTVHRDHKLLKDITRRSLNKKINFHVIDLTTPGQKDRNIGRIRNIGVKQVIDSIGQGNKDNILISQMDADTVFTPEYTRSLVQTYEKFQVSYTINTMYYMDQSYSELQVYRRKITTDYQAAANQFNLLYDGSFPGGGGPRITATAKAMVDVGGVPEIVMGEDSKLIANFQRILGKDKGAWIDNDVFAKYRARPDGYDAKYYLERLHLPVEFSDYDLKASALLETHLVSIQADPIKMALFNEAFEQRLTAAKNETARLRSVVSIMAIDLATGSRSLKPDIHYPAIVNNDWFIGLLKEQVRVHGSDVTSILNALTEIFPYHFSDPIKAETIAIAKLQAMTQLLILERRFGKNLSIAALDHASKKFPKTTERLISEKFETLQNKWKQGQLFDPAKPFPNAELIADLTALTKIKNSKNKALEPALSLIVRSYLDAVTAHSKFNDEILKTIQPLAKWSNYKIMSHQSKKAFEDGIANWRKYLADATAYTTKKAQASLQSADGKWKCSGCNNYHLDRPRPLPKADFTTPRLGFLIEMIPWAADLDSLDPFNKRITQYADQLTELYDSYLKLDLPEEITKQLDPVEFQKFKQTYTQKKSCVQFYNFAAN